MDRISQTTPGWLLQRKRCFSFPPLTSSPTHPHVHGQPARNGDHVATVALKSPHVATSGAVTPTPWERGRGRDPGYPGPPARIRTGGITAYGSCLGSWRQTAAQAFRLTHAVQRTWHAFPALRQERVLLARVFLGQAPSLHRLRRGLPRFVRRLRRYNGPVRLPVPVHRWIGVNDLPSADQGGLG